MIELTTKYHRGIITDDLRLNVWRIDVDYQNNPPMYYQNNKITGEPWNNAEEIEEYFYSMFKKFESDIDETEPTE